MRSSPTPARATAPTFSIATSSPARTAGSSASSAAASSSAGTRRSPSPPPKRRSCIRSASSPASRDRGDDPRHDLAHGGRRGEHRADPRRDRRGGLEADGQPVDHRAMTARIRATRSSIAAARSLWATGLAIRRAVLARISSRIDEPVLAQRRAGRGQVDDALGQPGQRRQLDRALDLDDLGLAAGALEVARGDPRVLRRDAHHAEPPQRLVQPVLARGRRDDHHARAEPQVEQLVDRPLGLLGEHVLPRDPEVGGAGLDVGRDVGRPHGDEPRVLEQQLAVVRPHLGGVDAERVEQVERVAHQRAARAPRAARPPRLTAAPPGARRRARCGAARR